MEWSVVLNVPPQAVRGKDANDADADYGPIFVRCKSNNCYGTGVGAANNGASVEALGTVLLAEPRAMLIDRDEIINDGFPVVPVHQTALNNMIFYYCADHSCSVYTAGEPGAIHLFRGVPD